MKTESKLRKLRTEREREIFRALGNMEEGKKRVLTAHLVDAVEVALQTIYVNDGTVKHAPYGQSQRQLEKIGKKAEALIHGLKDLTEEARSVLKTSAPRSERAGLRELPLALAALATLCSAKAHMFYKLSSAGGSAGDPAKRQMIELLCNAWPQAEKLSPEPDGRFGKVAAAACSMTGDWKAPSSDLLRAVIGRWQQHHKPRP